MQIDPHINVILIKKVFFYVQQLYLAMKWYFYEWPKKALYKDNYVIYIKLQQLHNYLYTYLFTAVCFN